MASSTLRFSPDLEWMLGECRERSIAHFPASIPKCRKAARSGCSRLNRGRVISKSDESCISDPKSEISDLTARVHIGRLPPVQLEISDFGSEMQDSSDFEISLVVDKQAFDTHAFFDARY